MIILVDVDGVVADLHVAWLGRYNEDYNDTLKTTDIRKWGIHEYVKPECGRKIYDYLREPGLYDKVPVIKGAADGIRKIRKLGHRVVFLSSGFFPDKVEWLAKNGLAIDYPYKDGRWETLGDVVLTGDKGLVKGDLLIDDYPRNLEAMSCDVLMFDQAWNWDNDKYRRVYNWDGLYQIIRDEYGNKK